MSCLWHLGCTTEQSLMRSGAHSCVLIENQRKGTTEMVEGGTASPPHRVSISRYRAVVKWRSRHGANCATKTCLLIQKVIKLSSGAHYAPASTFHISLNFLDHSQWDGVLWHNYARSVGVVSDGGSCGAGRRIFSWDFSAVKCLIWRQREERTYLQKTVDNKTLLPSP